MNYYKMILDMLKSGNINCITTSVVNSINHDAIKILSNKDKLSKYDEEVLDSILRISNILYNNTDRDLLPLEDGIYDILLELYKSINPNYQVGSDMTPIFCSEKIYEEKKVLINPFTILDEEFIENSLFIDELTKEPAFNKLDHLKTPFIKDEELSKSFIDTPHKYPDLVGTLDKCKFVLNSQAIERGVYDDSNVTIFERDFLYKHLKMGLLDTETPFVMVAELKYDGVSIEAEVSNRLISARSRGDTNNNLATDLTPVLKQYRFSHAPEILKEDVFGMKFEAIITYDNLYRLCVEKGKDYKNCRNAIVGIIGSNDANSYIDYINLIPLAMSGAPDRLTELEFMNKYFTKGEYLRYAIIQGNYMQVLFQVKKFVEEAEYMRNFLPFMYDGVVLSYIDPFMIDKLGRQNSVNKYSVAIKFNPLKKQSIFLGYTYSVGQNGLVTPMIHYNPVEFYGTVHVKSSGHSFKRFTELGLKEGDIIDIEYMNDVMPYVTKPNNQHNDENLNPVIPFIMTCPFCDTRLKITESMKSIMCPNKSCPERNISRMTNMLQKLNFKEFSEETLRTINITSLSDLFNLKVEDVASLGENNSQKFINNIYKLKIDPIYDYKIVGSLGFSSIAIEKWRLLLNNITLKDIVYLDDESLSRAILNIKGLGPATAEVIIEERELFKNDLDMILQMTNIIYTKGGSSGKIIRFSGFRPYDLINKLNDMGHSASEGAITKTTDILIVPYANYTSTKTSKVSENTLIVDVEEFEANINKYLN